ncbi:hypothetical protein BsWGS_27158 [Bradybaena similaris]
MAGLSREVLKWIQSLDLECQIKNPKWDLSNGYIIGEIISRYFPQQIQIHSFYKGISLAVKKKNWFILKNFILQTDIDLDMQVIDATIHCRDGAAVKLLEALYEVLTSRRLKRMPPEFYTSEPFYLKQKHLPAYQRTTATVAVKQNLRLTELLADEGSLDLSKHGDQLSSISQLQAQRIINDHLEHRRVERFTEPKRFGIKPTLGDCCVRSYGPFGSLRRVSGYFPSAAERTPDKDWKEIWSKCRFEFKDM